MRKTRGITQYLYASSNKTPHISKLPAIIMTRHSVRRQYKLRKSILLLTILFGFSQLGAQTIYSKEIEEQIKKVENNLGCWVKIEGKETFNILDRMAFHNVKGVSIAVIQNYKTIWAKGYGLADEGEKRPVTEKTLFHAASVSKSINSMGILKLAQDQKLDLNADINQYLTSWKFPYDAVSKGKKVSTLNLLSHTAGIGNSSPTYLATKKVATLIQDLNGVHSIMEPGLKSQYSNFGIAITQLLITDITKKTYEQYITETVFTPLGMTNSCYSEESLKSRKPFIATGYIDGKEIEGKRVIVSMSSAGGLWTTPSDLCSFITELQLEYQGETEKVLSKEMANKMLTPYIDKSAALGVFIEAKKNTKYFSHRGSVKGFNSCYYGSLEGGNGVAIMINSGNDEQIMDEIINSVATVYDWKEFYEPVNKKVIEVPADILQKYTGLYMAIKDRFFYVSKKTDGCYQKADGLTSKMLFTSEKDFFSIAFESEKQFITDAVGNVTGFTRTSGDSKMTVMKILSPDTINASPYFFYTAGESFFEDKYFDNAIKYFKRGLDLYPNTLILTAYIAHSNLFNNNYDAALKIYKEHLGETAKDGRKWTDIISQDFVKLKNNKYDTKLMDKVFADLKLKIPKEYETN